MTENKFDNIADSLDNSETPISEPAAIFSANIGEITFEDDTSVDDEGTVIDKKDEPVVENAPEVVDVKTGNPLAAETTEEPVTTEESGDSTESLTIDPDEYTDFALLTMQKIKDGVWELDEKDVPKDMDALTYDKLYEKDLELKKNAAEKELYDSAGEASEFLEYLIKGGDREVVKDALSSQAIISLDPTNEDNQKAILIDDFKKKDIREEDSKDLIEAILDKGKGEERAKAAIERRIQERDQALTNAKIAQKEKDRVQAEQYQTYVSSIKETVETGEVGGYNVSKAKQQKILDSMFKPTELVDVQNPTTGQIERQRITKFQQLQYEVNKDPKKLAALALWLLEGGKFDFVKDQAQEQRDDSLRAILQGRKTKTTVKRKTENNAFDNIAKQVAEYNAR